MRMMFLLFLIVPTASAQYDLFDLATSGDGSTAYFASTLSLARPGANSPADAPGRIFRITPARFQVHLERPSVQLPLGTDGYRDPIRFTNYFDLSRPQVSQDGRVFAVVGKRSCTGGSPCGSAPTLQTTVTGRPGGPIEIPGAGVLSRNGRYLLIYESGAIGGCSYVVDFYTGPFTRPPQCLSSSSFRPQGRRMIADDGTAVVPSSSLYLLRNSTVKIIRLPANVPAEEAAIDASADLVVYSTRDLGTGRRSIRLLRLSDDRDIPLVSLADSLSYSPHISADGQRVLYLSNASGLPQIHVVATSGGEPRQISNDSSGVLSAVMSDDGEVAWYLSGAARLYQVRLDTGETRERFGSTPQLTTNWLTAPGSYGTISGAGFSDETYAASSHPLPLTLGGVTVTVNGVLCPLFSVSPTTIAYQVPSSVVVPAVAEVHCASVSPFVPQLRFDAAGLLNTGSFLQNPQSPSQVYGGWDAYTVHENWSSLVTAANPALPGEIVHMYGTNWGSVDPTPKDGYPAPLHPLSRTIIPVTCRGVSSGNSTRRDVPVLFAGLAPGLVGVYQLDVQLPLDNLRGAMQISCSREGNIGNFWGSFAVKP